MNDDPKYHYFPGVGMVRTNNAKRAATADWCPRSRSPQHLYAPSALDPRFERCALCGWQRRAIPSEHVDRDK